MEKSVLSYVDRFGVLRRVTGFGIGWPVVGAMSAAGVDWFIVDRRVTK